MSIGVAYKTCKMCGLPKPITEFHIESQHRDGRRPSCATCTNARTRARTKAKRVLGSKPERIRDEANRFAGYPHCRVCTVVMLPDGDVGNRPWTRDETGCESCGRKGWLGREVKL